MSHTLTKCVCVVLDKPFMIGFKAMINSILRHTEGFDEKILCIDIDLDESDRESCKEIYSNIQFVQPILENYNKLPKHAPALKNAFFKLEIFRLAKTYDRILYVDTDIIFVKSIQPLLDMPLRTELTICYHPKYKEHNTGLMLLPKLSEKPYDSMMDALKSMKRAWLGDQAVINKLIRKKLLSVTQLNRKWNTTKRQIVDGRIKNYFGIHMVGKKPWNGGEGGRYKTLEDLWWEYAK